jgi:probable O-glycosylation ligase (exosortase A-associated)
VGTLLVYIVMGGNALVSLFYPWMGIVLAYLIAVLTPQNIWWWAFQGVRPLYWVLVPTLMGFVFSVLRHKVSLSALNTKLNWCVGILWLTSTLSFYFGPYVDVYNDYRFYDPEFMFSAWQKTCLAYFVAVLLIDSTAKLKAMVLVMIVTTIYMTYWANEQYFVYDKFGRLHGPRGVEPFGIYTDENNFAVLFVVGFPFLLYLDRYLNKRVLSWVIWPIIGFSWHAVFLTASRGALLAIVAILLVFVVRLKKNAAGLLILVGFLGAFIWQGGDLMKSRSSTIANYQEEESAASRLDAWEAAMGMMAAHPVTGVGFASFGQAFPDFSDTVPRIAHNTFFQISGECGVAAGLAYLVLMSSTLNRLRKNGVKLRRAAVTEKRRLYLCLNEACLMGLLGFFVCSLFLSLEKYEVLYYLLVVANGTLLGGSLLLSESDSGMNQVLRDVNKGNSREGNGQKSPRSTNMLAKP